ncbi:hypothetical protein [Streptococcus sp.]|uniref:hypothetical protein n=1 Tax=Streptococcus sp. TaxID=1306 RepID=UPI00391C08FC
MTIFLISSILAKSSLKSAPGRIVRVVVKTILDSRTNSSLISGKWRLALGQEVAMNDAGCQAHPRGQGSRFQGTIFRDGPRSVDQLTVELTSKGFLAKEIVDGLGHFKSSDTSVELAHRAIWESTLSWLSPYYLFFNP